MNEIKVINKREGGSLYHYAHFMCDCLLPEIVMELYKYDTIIRKKNLDQTIGNFSKIYEVVMNNKNIELLDSDFNNNNSKTTIVVDKNVLQESDFQKFRSYIFNKFNIVKEENTYPQILLIKRGNSEKLINDTFLENKLNNLPKNTQKWKLSNGNERREINNIDQLELYLKNNCNSFKSIYLEEMDFEKQVTYFYNAQIIIGAHGAGFSNMLFCNPNTIILEVSCNKSWYFFDKISKILKLKYYKLNKNNLESIINAFHLIINKRQIKLKS